MATDPFPIDNVPFGVISTNTNASPRPATIIGNTVLDLSVLEGLGAFDGIPHYPVTQRPLQATHLNDFAALPKAVRSATRIEIQELWRSGELRGRYADACLPADTVRNQHVPMVTVNYADYVSSRGHFENLQNLIGTPATQRAPFYHMPTGYYGNSRNIVVSGTPVYRFHGVIDQQFQRETSAVAGPSKKFDYELELGIYLSRGKHYGETIKVEEVDDYVFGVVLLNDWSGRDIQRAESGGPTGPFLAKSGCVTISPWIVTLEALEAARMPRQHAPVVPFVEHLSEDRSKSGPCFDIRCSVSWKLPRDRAPTEVSRARYSETYWTYRQLLAHQTANGSMIGTGDLIGTGTMSMFESDDIGRCCLSERNYQGTKAIELGGGETRMWIEDGDEIALHGWVHDPATGKALFGFGDCRGLVKSPQNAGNL